jgi:methionyl aminopeptidase
MIIIKNKKAIEKMKKAGHLLATVFEDIKLFVKEGITTLQIDTLIEKKLLESGLKPECKGYAGYRHSTCISLNDVIVHGVPSNKIVLKSGDFVKIDVVASFNGYCADMARYFFVGNVSPVVKKLAWAAQNALDAAIELAVPGNRLSDISSCVQREVEKDGFNVVRCFAGHGIGRNMHEDPEIPNFGKPGKGPILQSGMALAIEPMITQGAFEVKFGDDGWTAKTADGGYAAHVEDTVLITDSGPQVLTRLS